MKRRVRPRTPVGGAQRALLARLVAATTAVLALAGAAPLAAAAKPRDATDTSALGLEDLSVAAAPAVAGAADTAYTLTFQAAGTGALAQGVGIVEVSLPEASIGQCDMNVGGGAIRDLTTGVESPLVCEDFLSPELDPQHLLPARFRTPIAIAAGDEVQIVTPALLDTPASAGRHRAEVAVSEASSEEGLGAEGGLARQQVEGGAGGEASATAEYSLAAKLPTTAVGAVVAPSIAGDSAAQYTIDFRASPQGQLNAETGEIVVELPEAELCPPWIVNGGYYPGYDIPEATIADLTTHTAGEAHCEPHGDAATFRTPIAIRPGDEVAITTKPNYTAPSPAGSHPLTVATSTDAASGGAYTLGQPKQAIAMLSASVDPATAGATHATYDLRFRASNQGSLPAKWGTIGVAVPELGGCGEVEHVLVKDLTTGASDGVECGSYGGLGVVPTDYRPWPDPLTFETPQIGAGDEVEVEIEGVNNPQTAGQESIDLQTAADGPAGAQVTLAPQAPLTQAAATIGNTGSGAPDVPYTVSLTTSPTGNLVANQGVVTLQFPPGTGLGSCDDVVVEDLTTGEWAPKPRFIGIYEDRESLPNCRTEGEKLSFTVPFAVAGGSQLKIGLPGFTNPEAVGANSILVSTSSDRAVAAPFTLTQGFEVTGKVTYADEGGQSPVAGSAVQVCSAQHCATGATVTNGQGEYRVEVPEAGNYTVTAYPPTSDLYSVNQASVGPVAVAAGAATANVELPTLEPLPKGVTFNGESETVPHVFWGSPARLAVDGCKGGLGMAAVSSLNEQTAEPEVSFGGLVETPAESGTYETTVEPLYPSHGTGTITTAVACPSPSALVPSSGPSEGGNRVQISGEGLDGATAVTFGGRPAASFTVVSDSLIEAVAPAGSGSVEVAVTTPSGVAAAPALDKYSYIDLTGLAPAEGPGAGGTRVTITGTGLADAAAVYFGNSLAGEVDVVSDEEITATAPAGAGKAPVTILTADGGESGPGGPAFAYTGDSNQVASGRAVKTPARPHPPVPAAPVTPTRAPPGEAAAIAPVALDLAASPFDATETFKSAAEGFEQIADLLENMVSRMAAACAAGSGLQNALDAALSGAEEYYIKALATAVVVQSAPRALWWATTQVPGAVGDIAEYLLTKIVTSAPVITGVTAYLAFLTVFKAVAALVFDHQAVAQELDAILNCSQEQLLHLRKSGQGAKQYQIKIDPSGSVEDVSGEPLAGATVTLQQAETSVGPFTAPASGSAVMSPSVNPQTTGAEGIFHWDVIAGDYRIQAEKSGCTDPGEPSLDTVTSPVFPVPPPQVGLMLTLSCPGESPPSQPTVEAVEETSGPTSGGTVVDVRGAGFTGAASVRFGATPAADLVVLSPTELQVTSPPGSGVVDVTVTTAGGTSATGAADRYTYTEQREPEQEPEEKEEAKGPTGPSGGGGGSQGGTGDGGGGQPPTSGGGGQQPTSGGGGQQPTSGEVAGAPKAAGRGAVSGFTAAKSPAPAQELKRALAACARIGRRDRRSACVVAARRRYRARELARALAICRKRRRGARRGECVSAARRRYGRSASAARRRAGSASIARRRVTFASLARRRRGLAALTFDATGGLAASSGPFLPTADLGPGEPFDLLAISGDTVVAGNEEEHDVIVFSRASGTWEEEAELAVPSDAGGSFPSSLAISGETIVVGDDEAEAGPAKSRDSGGQLGYGPGTGSVYVFSGSGGDWRQTAELSADNGRVENGFGGSVAISGQTLVVGAVSDDTHEPSHNHPLYVFTETAGAWHQSAELTREGNSPSTASDGFGEMGVADGTIFAIHTFVGPGRTIAGEEEQRNVLDVFGESAGGWQQVAELAPTDATPEDEFGESVAGSGDTIVVGAPHTADNGEPYAGAAFVFEDLGGSWRQTAELTSSEERDGERFGWAVAAGPEGIVVGAPGTGVAEPAVYAFDDDGGDWRQTAQLTSERCGFGEYVATSADTVATANDSCPNGVEVFEAPAGPDITAGPPQRTRATSATLEFTGDTDGASFECSLDDAAFSPCRSPQSYSGLADGEHRFAVRESDSGAGPGPASERSWFVYTHPPTLTIDSAPSGTVTSQSAEVAFHATAEDGEDDDIGYSCALDAAAATPCSSPLALTDLQPGPHRLTVTAVDDVGNVSAPATASWTVAGGSGPPPASAGCVAPARSLAAIGYMFMQGRGGTCITPGKRGAFLAKGPVTLDGVAITPERGTLLTLEALKGDASRLSSSGSVSVQLGDLPAHRVPGAFTWTQPTGGRVATTTAPLLSSIAGLPAKVNLTALELGDAGGGSVKMTVSVELPKSFSALPGGAKGVSADFTLTASNQTGLDFAGRLNVASLYLGTTQVENLSLGYDTASGLLDGSARILLTPRGPSVQSAVAIGPPSPDSVLGCCVRKLEIEVQEINEPIFDTPLFLQSIGGSASTVGTPGGGAHPELSGNGSLSLGPRIGSAPPAVELDGSVTLALSTPWSWTATGAATIRSFPVAQGKLTYTQGGLVQLSGSVKASIGGYGFAAAIADPTFFTAGGAYNVTATGEVDLGSLGKLQGKVVFSNKGFAACAPIAFAGESWAIGWGVLADGTRVVLDDTCDMGPFTETATASRTVPPGSPVALTLARGRTLHLLAVRGAGAAPALTVTGPGSVELSAPPGEAARKGAGLILPDPATDTTYVLLAPGAGRYLLSSQNTAIVSVRAASSLPPVSVRVRTRTARGGRRELVYHQTPAPGQRLELYEQGGSGGGRLLASTTTAGGRVLYTPQPGPAAARSILALTVSGSGLTRAAEVVARYRVASPPPGALQRIVRRGPLLRWQRAPRAARYDLAFTLAGGATRSVATTAPRAPIPAHAVAVGLLAVDALGRPGPARSVALRPRITHRSVPHNRSPQSK